MEQPFGRVLKPAVRSELASLVNLLDATGTRPLIDRTLPMDRAPEGFAAMNDGELFGKVVFTR